MKGGSIFNSISQSIRGKSRNNLPISKTVASNRAMPVPSKLIKRGIKSTIREVRDGIIPSILIRWLPIKDRGVPFNIRSPDNLGKSVPFSISVGSDLNIGKTMAEGQQVDITINGVNALLSSNLERAIMYLVFVPFKLPTGMDSLALANIGILMQDGNHRTTLRLNNTTNSNNGKISELVVINTTHINSAGVGGFVNNSDIIASKATIGTTVNQRAIGIGFVGRNAVGDAVDIASQDTPDIARKAWVGRRGLTMSSS